MKRHYLLSFILAVVLCMGMLLSSAKAADGWRDPGRHGKSTPCEALMDLDLPDTTITLAETVLASEDEPFTSPFSYAGEGVVTSPFCRVAGTVEPEINFEVWIPLEGWNGKFNGVGLGVYLGGIGYRAMATSFARGYATASTDGGHVSPGTATSWGIDNFDAIVSLGHVAHHEMTVKAKAIIQAFAGHGPQYSYFTGCSSGGWQGLTEAQRYPEDYDGVLAGAPAINVVHLHAGSIWNYFQAREVQPRSKFALVYNAVVDACDENDGVDDGIVENPQVCGFDVASLQCPEGTTDTSGCLTTGEVAAFEEIYAGARFSNGDQIYPGWPLTSESGLTSWWAGPPDYSNFFVGFAFGTFKDLAYNGEGPVGVDPYTIEQFELDRDVPYADATIGTVMNSNSPDLKEFEKLGGKLILYHGWSDQLISANNTVGYYENVLDTVGQEGDGLHVGDPNDHKLKDVQKFARLFMVPGMGHCSGGPSRYVFDGLTALEQWVEHNQAPDEITASNSSMTHPLCPYPQVAHYNGTGDTNDASNFYCAEDDL